MCVCTRACICIYFPFSSSLLSKKKSILFLKKQHLPLDFVVEIYAVVVYCFQRSNVIDVATIYIHAHTLVGSSSCYM